MIDFNSSKSTLSITEHAFVNAAEDLGCDIAAIKAVADVESNGKGYLADGRPRILFEKHIFRKYTNKKYDDSHPSISGKRGGYQGGQKEYKRLEKALELNSEAALMSASWGKFQIMGFNYNVCGFDSVDEFVEAMVESADRQLEAFISFVEHNNLDQYLKSHNWAKFAHRYNGPRYRENNYHTKMAKAYEEYANTSPSLSSDPGSSSIFTITSVRDLQMALEYLGFSPGVIDNKMGPNTKSAIRAFQHFVHLPQTGKFEASIKAAVQSAYCMIHKRGDAQSTTS